MKNFDMNLINKIDQQSIRTKLTFGKYKGEIIESVLEYDSEYIIFIYDNGILNPNDELLKVIHATKKDIEIHELHEECIKNERINWDSIFGGAK